jgi:hypothetical protein
MWTLLGSRHVSGDMLGMSQGICRTFVSLRACFVAVCRWSLVEMSVRHTAVCRSSLVEMSVSGTQLCVDGHWLR